MSPRVTPIKKEPFVQRSVKPAAAVFLTAAVSTAVYSMSQDIDVPWLRALVVNISGPLAFASIGFGALLVYPMAFFRGAGAGERIRASLFTPLVWVIQEIIRVTEFFTWQESLYYGLCPGLLLAITGTFGLMGLCEMICRGIGKHRGATQKVITPLPVAAFLFSLLALYIILIWGMGVHWFYIYMEGYKSLFL